MPELPEVETMRRGITSTIGRLIDRAEQPACRFKPCVLEPGIEELDRRLRGRRIAALERLGKRVVIVLEDQNRLVFEPRMTGLLLTVAPPGPQHRRLIVHLRGGPPLTFWDRRGLGTIRLHNAADYEARVRRRIGPDALSIDAATFHQQITRGRRAIKVALLDQTLIAGVGNLYASELCFRAGVDPRARCDLLTRPQTARLHAAMVQVLLEAIAAGGSTLADGTYRTAQNEAGGFQSRHLVYDRAGQPCPRCLEPQNTIRRIVQAGRCTFLCSGCQRRRGGSAFVPFG